MVTTNTLQRLSLHTARQTLAFELLSALVVWTGNLAIDSSAPQLSMSLRTVAVLLLACRRQDQRRQPLTHRVLQGYALQHSRVNRCGHREPAVLGVVAGSPFADPPPRLWRQNGNHPTSRAQLCETAGPSCDVLQRRCYTVPVVGLFSPNGRSSGILDGGGLRLYATARLYAE